MWIPSASEWPSTTGLTKRGSDKDPSWRVVAVASIIVVLFLIIAVGIYAKLRSLRAKSGRPPRFLPGQFLKRKWAQWSLRPGKGKYSSQLQDNEDTSYSSRPSAVNGSGAREMQGTTTETPASGAPVNRNTSIRSIMTLPAYSPAARENERILGREGERGGIDVVVEFPETVEEEEIRRDDEMESLYQIRVARRQEQAEREERRRQRREARERNDQAALAQMRREGRMRHLNGGGNQLSTTLIAEHQAATQQRERRVPSVQYAEVGVARHDGTRIRANSAESDNHPLLDSAAPLGASQSTDSRMTHHRDFSATSVLSNSTTASDTAWPGAGRNGSTGSGTTGAEAVPLTRSRSPSGSRLTLETTRGSDLGEARIPPPEPPQYDALGWEEAPPYTSPVDVRTTPRLPEVQRLPSIHITQSITPVDERPSQRIGEESQNEARS
ncbi:uncharacterized protein K452DRAFT_319278 [Aplosporella prunicola CBS 121167]|uniref:Uncharacterized protein n=1 Tax=Aplosporella prunicola CBS 121167 TaxID=1176127 RepID=A0A6A6BCQ3_9PEZI|nr:uncharacterized protein K452DRAFT_319278 [Aplosporella prunicola CBS 121167]KAF2141004.1 hypothetical protein K452DRAFT_319278 [Aplosporella prunicola CBS 121167]